MYKIPIKLISKEEAISAGLSHNKGGGGQHNLAYVVEVDSKTNKTKRVRVDNIKTGRKQFLFDKGKKFKMSKEIINNN